MCETETLVTAFPDGNEQSQTFATTQDAEAARNRQAADMEEEMRRELLGLPRRVEDVDPETRQEEMTVRTRYAQRQRLAGGYRLRPMTT